MNMWKVLLIMVACLWLCGVAGPGWCAGKAAAFDTAAERIGGLRLGMPAGEAEAAAPCPPRKGREVLEQATGDFIQVWTLPCGLELKLAGPKKGGPKTVAAVTVTAPSELATGRGVRIGSTEAKATTAYGRFRDREMSRAGASLVAGSVYDGLILTFKNGRVARIFLGAAAE